MGNSHNCLGMALRSWSFGNSSFTYQKRLTKKTQPKAVILFVREGRLELPRP